MSEARDPRRMSYAEYVAFEEASETKHEWIDGAVCAMSGGSPEHSRLQARMIVAPTAALAGKPSAPFTSDLRIVVADAKRSTYPDVTVICDKIQPTSRCGRRPRCSAREPRRARWGSSPRAGRSRRSTSASSR